VFARHLTTASCGRRLEHGRTDGNDSLQRAGVCRPRAEHPTRAFDASVALRTVFGPEEYGIAGREPDCLPSMADLDREEGIVALESLGLESRMARDERPAGSDIASPHARC
jgi:hypothetical protein